ncbi:cell wall-binding repeat-containing protein [Arthrobacter sp. KK5.5]|uniref:cell wall-binding repeat-containing protein n=1 Tax=Arthrobacter sp. KK5.5 TaxID=3373084 RepID=UPI003EE72982
MRRIAAALALLAVAPLTLAGAAQANTTCEVYSGGGWLTAPCPTSTSAPASPTSSAPTSSAPTSAAPTSEAPARLAVERIAGIDRYATAAAISAAHFAPGVAAVYLANGNGIDALAAGPAVDGPILTVPASGTLPAAVAAELARLDPGKVVVLGGTMSVGDAMVEQAVDAAAR